VIRKEAWPFYRTISGVRLCWELEEPKGPKGHWPGREGATLPPLDWKGGADAAPATGSSGFGLHIGGGVRIHPENARMKHVQR